MASGVRPAVSITYCQKCDFLARAAWIAQELLHTFGDSLAGVTMVPGSGGIFEVRIDGEPEFSTKTHGRFPETRERREAVGARLEDRQAEMDPPAVLLSEGNPLVSNELNRFLLMKAKERRLATQVLAAASPIDSLICRAGLDVGAFGLQVFDARRLYTREMPIQPSVPLLLLQVAGVALAETSALLEPKPEDYRPLTEYLGHSYPPTHMVAHLANSSDPEASAASAAPLSAFDSLVPRFGPASTLFVDLLRQPRAAN